MPTRSMHDTYAACACLYRVTAAASWAQYAFIRLWYWSLGRYLYFGFEVTDLLGA